MATYQCDVIEAAGAHMMRQWASTPSVIPAEVEREGGEGRRREERRRF